MLELLWFLLPVAAASGWYFARRSVDVKEAVPDSNTSADCYKGINYLLNDQPDKAVELFTRLFNVNRDTLDTHIAIGSLFRRRGEVDRAIRIHQHLLNQTSLPQAQRHVVQLELGHDFLKAGLLDRAEKVLTDLLDMDAQNEVALNLLVRVYQQEKDWDQAIAVLRRLPSTTARPQVLAQYYCELADVASARRDYDTALRRVEQALQADPACARASLVEGRVRAAGGDFVQAINAYKRVREQNTAYIGEIIEPLVECYYKLGQPASVIDFLEEVVKVYGNVRGALALTELHRERNGAQDAAVFLSHFLSQRPSMVGLIHLIELHREETTGELRDTLRVLRNALERMAERKPRYKCRQCGFGGKSLHWMCPSCTSWESLRPIELIQED